MSKLYLLLALTTQANLAMQPANVMRMGLQQMSKRAFLTKAEKFRLEHLIETKKSAQSRLKLVKSPLIPALGTGACITIPLVLIMGANTISGLCTCAVGGTISGYYLSLAIDDMRSEIRHNAENKIAKYRRLDR